MRTTTAPTRIAALAAGAAAALLALAACSSGGAGTGNSAPTTGSSSSSSSAPSSSGAVLKTGSTSLGTVVVDGKGLTAYVFDKDTANSGTSVCSGACAAQWPAIEAGGDHPAVAGVTGTVGTITGIDGNKQVTLNGHPLYTFVHDSSAGDVTGQGFLGIWWVVGPNGTKIMSSSSSTPSTGGGY